MGALRPLLLWTWAPLGSRGEEKISDCICDLSTHCDADCCCDPDCVGGWKEGFECLPSGPKEHKSHMCVSSSYMEEVNPTRGLSVFQDDMRGLFCVEVENKPVSRRLYSNVEKAVESNIADEIEEQKLTTFQVPVHSGYPKIPTAHGYQSSEVIYSIKAVKDNGEVAPLKGDGSLETKDTKKLDAIFSIPMPNANGDCYDFPIRFLKNIPSTQCRQRVNLQDVCQPVDTHFKPTGRDALSGSLDFKRTLGALVVPTVVPAETATSKCTRGCIAPEASCAGESRTKKILVWENEAWKEHDTGTIDKDICDNKRGSQASFQPVSGLLWDDESAFSGIPAPVCGCENAVVGMHYRITYKPTEDSGQWTEVRIKKIRVEVTYADLISPSCGLVDITRQSTVTFLEEDKPLDWRSGNPGYLVGADLRIGICKKGSTVQECESFKDKEGRAFLFPGFSGIEREGKCLLSTNKNLSDLSVLRHMKFGEDTSFGCIHPLTQTELETFCGKDDDDVLQMFKKAPPTVSGGTPTVWSFPFTHVAAHGNTEIDAMNDWVFIESIGEGRIGETGPCNVLVGMEFTFLYAYFGEFENPQPRIIAARGQKIRTSLSHTLSPNEKQPFFFNIIVKFVRKPDLGELIPPVPPFPKLPLQLPHDFFYPFILGSAVTYRVWALLIACSLWHM